MLHFGATPSEMLNLQGHQDSAVKLANGQDITKGQAEK